MSERITIIRAAHDHENPYFMMRRDTAQDAQLSYEARGILAYLLSKPSDWRVMVPDLERTGCKRDKVYRVLRELTASKYVKRVPVRQGGKFVGVEYHVYEAPFTEIPDTVLPDTLKTTLQKKEKEQKKEREQTPPTPIPRKRFAVKVYSGQDTYADGRYIDAMSQDFADSCNALFYAYLDALEAAGRKPDTSVDELWSQNYTATTALAKNRRLPEQITDYVTFVYSDKSDGFYKKLPAPIKLQAVANALPTWIQQKREVGTSQVTRPEHRVHTVAAVDPATVLTPEQRAAMMAEARAEYRKARTEVTAHV